MFIYLYFQGIVTHTCKPSTPEAETENSQAQSQHELQSSLQAGLIFKV